jgi:RNA polymerase sigma-B factor
VNPTRRPHDELDPRFDEWHRTGDRRLRNSLIDDHTWVASFCAARFSHRGEARDDLLQVALLGLVNAVDRFDPTRGVAFSTFAVPTITGELRRYFRDKTWSVHVTRRAKEASRTVAVVVDELTATYGRTPTIAEITERSGLSGDQVLEALEVNDLHRSISLEPAEGDGPSEDSALGVYDRGFASAEARSIVGPLMRALPTERDRHIVELRFVEGLTQREIARRIGVSQVQVSRLLRANLDRMRRAARARAPHRQRARGTTDQQIPGHSSMSHDERAATVSPG